jgi:SAM-dependent methyltransferase
MERARQLLASVASVLDLGTGGGERLAEILRGFRGRAVAIEEWAVNAPLAAGRLRALGADVLWCSALRLPLVNESFELVLDRHEALEPAEVARVLAPGGLVLTQQVWNYASELRRFFPRRTDFGDHFHQYQQGFHVAGLEVVDARTHAWRDAYASLGDIVYMLCIAPWEVPDFDPLGADLESLLDLERELSTPNGIVMSSGAYIIEARKPA